MCQTLMAVQLSLSAFAYGGIFIIYPDLPTLPGSSLLVWILRHFLLAVAKGHGGSIVAGRPCLSWDVPDVPGGSNSSKQVCSLVDFERIFACCVEGSGSEDLPRYQPPVFRVNPASSAAFWAPRSARGGAVGECANSTPG